MDNACLAGLPKSAVEQCAGRGNPRRFALSVLGNARKNLKRRAAVMSGEFGKSRLCIDRRPVHRAERPSRTNPPAALSVSHFNFLLISSRFDHQLE